MVIRNLPPRPPIKRRRKQEEEVGSRGLHLAGSIGSSEESRFKKKHQNFFLNLIRERKVHFNYNELEALSLIYYKYQLETKTSRTLPNMTENQFMHVLHKGFDMTHDFLNVNVIRVVLLANAKGVTGFSLESWVRCLSLFLRGALEEQILHCFKVYDYYNENFLRKDFLLGLLKGSMVVDTDNPDEIVREMIDIVIKKMDFDRDSKISFQDYRTAVLRNPLLLESFGQCLPSRYAAAAFVSTFTHEVGKV